VKAWLFFRDETDQYRATCLCDTCQERNRQDKLLAKLVMDYTVLHGTHPDTPSKYITSTI
jgi:hypothetical protein